MCYCLFRAKLKTHRRWRQKQNTDAKYYTGYSLTTRGVFYGARMISAQLGTEFEIPEYDKIKKVYSIWICMNAPKYIGNAISEYKLEKTDLIPGIPDRRKEYDKLSIVMVCLNTKKETDDQFLGILQTLFNTELPEKEKKDRLEQEYEIQMENGFGKDVVQGYPNVIAALKKGYASIGFERGRNILVDLNKFLVNKRMIIKEGKGYKFNSDFHY